MNGFKEECFNKFIEGLEKSIKNYQARIEAWQKVKRIYKKDGTSYKNIKENFLNLTSVKDYKNELEFKIYYTDASGKIKEDTIYQHQTIENLPFEPKEEQEVFGGCGWKEYILIDAEQLEIMINNLIENLQKYLEEAKEQYKKGVALFPEFWNKLDDLAKFIYSNTDKKEQISLNYAFIDIIKKQFSIY